MAIRTVTSSSHQLPQTKLFAKERVKAIITELAVDPVISPAQQLFRIGDTLQKIFYEYRETFFDEVIGTVEMKDGKLYIGFPKDYPLDAELDLPFKFPSDSCATLEEKYGVLSYLKCEDALLWMHHIMKYMLEGLVSKIEALRVKPRFAREVISVRKNGIESFYNHADNSVEDGLHVLWKVTLENGEEYALDLTGAQLGWFEPVVAWSTYLKNQIQEDGVLEIDPVDIYYAGRGPRELSHGADPFKTAFNETASSMIMPCLIKVLCLKEWTLNDVFGISEELFEKNQAYLVQNIRILLESGVRRSH